jgi:hypothetical protein
MEGRPYFGRQPPSCQGKPGRSAGKMRRRAGRGVRERRRLADVSRQDFRRGGRRTRWPSVSPAMQAMAKKTKPSIDATV